MSAYYNENDPKAAAWLRQLISENLIAPGVVDERSITEVKPHELTSYTQCHFFGGLGGWSLALRLAGWPDDRPVWTGSCPCQPFSTAGKGKGTEDERHLWPVFASLIKSCKPSVCFGEQVASKAGRAWLAGVFADLEGMGYQRAGADLCAAGVGAPHIRQRLYWVAHHHHQGLQRRECGELSECAVELPAGTGGACGGVVQPNSDGREEGSPAAKGPRHWDSIDAAGCGAGRVGNTNIKQIDTTEQGQSLPCEGLLRCWASYRRIPCRDGKTRRIPLEPAFFPLASRVPARVVRLRGYGNAIVPQVAAEFITAFEEALHHERPRLQLNHAMPAIGDIYRKGTRLYVEVTHVSAKQIKYMIHPADKEVSVDPAEFEVLAARSIERGAVLERGGGASMNVEDY